MLSKDLGIFVQLPNESERRVLHPGTVIDASNGTYTIEFEEENSFIEAGQEVHYYYEIKNKFVQHTAHIDMVSQTNPKCVVCIKLIGDSIPSDSRQCYRVSMVMANFTAKIGPEDNCQLLDVSATGFSVFAKQRYNLGETIDATLRYENDTFTGRAHVMSINETSKPGRFRYGLHCVDDKKSNRELLRGLQLISVSVQRQQLRRIAKSA